MKISMKDFCSKYDQIRRKLFAVLVTFTEETLNGKLHFLCTVSFCIFVLTLSRRKSLSYRNQSIYLKSKSVPWFLYDGDPPS